MYIIIHTVLKLEKYHPTPTYPEVHLACSHLHFTQHGRQQRRLAASHRPHNGYQFAIRYGNVDTVIKRGE